jgi:hypothetical protein
VWPNNVQKTGVSPDGRSGSHRGRRGGLGRANSKKDLVTARSEVFVPYRLARHHEELFGEELIGWYTDPALWPRDRSLKMLKEWCSFELHTVVVDTGASPLEDDELEG